MTADPIVTEAGIIYPVTVNYDTRIEEMVRLGRYDYSDPNITSEHFPTKRAGQADIVLELVHFAKVISTENALRELDPMGYRPAELHELLAFGVKYPNVQREFPVIALGSVWQRPLGNRYCAYLHRDGSERDLYLDWIDRDWFGICRFAAVRK